MVEVQTINRNKTTLQQQQETAEQHHRILTLVSNHYELTPPTATIQNGN